MSNADSEAETKVVCARAFAAATRPSRPTTVAAASCNNDLVLVILSVVVAEVQAGREVLLLDDHAEGQTRVPGCLDGDFRRLGSGHSTRGPVSPE